MGPGIEPGTYSFRDKRHTNRANPAHIFTIRLTEEKLVFFVVLIHKNFF